MGFEPNGLITRPRQPCNQLEYNFTSKAKLSCFKEPPKGYTESQTMHSLTSKKDGIVAKT